MAALERTREVFVDDAGELYVGGTRVTRGGGWVRIGADDPRIPRLIRRIAVHLVASPQSDGSTIVCVDRVRVADVLWDDVDVFLALFDSVWVPHLREEVAKVLETASA